MQAGTQHAPTVTGTDIAAGGAQHESSIAKTGPGPVPEMRKFTSFRHFASWYTEPPPGFSSTQPQLDKASNYTWCKGCKRQRWSDYRMLWSAVTSKTNQLTADGTTADNAIYADAAEALDLQHQMQPCTYSTKYLKRKGSKVAAETESSLGEATDRRSAAPHNSSSCPGAGKGRRTKLVPGSRD